MNAFHHLAHPPFKFLHGKSFSVGFHTASLTFMHSFALTFASFQPGDWIHIPAGLRHRVEGTALDTETIWLALHYLAD